jgi:hypothetical protein
MEFHPAGPHEDVLRNEHSVLTVSTLVDPLLEKIIANSGDKAGTAQHVLGQVAIASAKMAYQIYRILSRWRLWHIFNHKILQIDRGVFKCGIPQRNFRQFRERHWKALLQAAYRFTRKPLILLFAQGINSF